MAVWTVTGVGPGGRAFLNCKIVAVPESGGGLTFLVFTPNGDLPIISSTSNPPSFTGFQLGGLTWNVSTSHAIPRNPPGGYTLAGFYWNSGGAGPGSAEGSWQAEATGGGPRPKPPKKSSAKSSRKLSKKSPSKSSSKKSPRKPTSKKSSVKSSRKRSS